MLARMQREISVGTERLHHDWAFEPTVFWERFVTGVRSAHTSYAESHDIVLRELRLQPATYARALQAMLLRDSRTHTRGPVSLPWTP